MFVKKKRGFNKSLCRLKVARQHCRVLVVSWKKKGRKERVYWGWSIPRHSVVVNSRVQIGIHKSLHDQCSVLWIIAVCNQFLGVDVAVV